MPEPLTHPELRRLREAVLRSYRLDDTAELPTPLPERVAEFRSQPDGGFVAVLDLAIELRSELDQARARISQADLEAQMDRVTDLFEKWAAEENEHRTAGEFGIAEGLHVAIEELRGAVHGKESADV